MINNNIFIRALNTQQKVNIKEIDFENDVGALRFMLNRACMRLSELDDIKSSRGIKNELEKELVLNTIKFNKEIEINNDN